MPTDSPCVFRSFHHKVLSDSQRSDQEEVFCCGVSPSAKVAEVPGHQGAAVEGAQGYLAQMRQPFRAKELVKD